MHGKGVVAGLISVLVASWVMNQFQRSWTKQKHRFEKPHGAQSLQIGTPADPPNPSTTSVGEDSTEHVADVVYQCLSKPSQSPEEKRQLGTIVHYCFGMAAETIYGAAVRHLSGSTIKGVIYGGLIWLLVDEGLIPLMGFSKPPQEYPLSTHAYAFSSHLVYGFALESVRRPMREFLS